MFLLLIVWKSTFIFLCKHHTFFCWLSESTYLIWSRAWNSIGFKLTLFWLIILNSSWFLFVIFYLAIVNVLFFKWMLCWYWFPASWLLWHLHTIKQRIDSKTILILTCNFYTGSYLLYFIFFQLSMSFKSLYFYLFTLFVASNIKYLFRNCFDWCLCFLDSDLFKIIGFKLFAWLRFRIFTKILNHIRSIIESILKTWNLYDIAQLFLTFVNLELFYYKNWIFFHILLLLAHSCSSFTNLLLSFYLLIILLLSSCL